MCLSSSCCVQIFYSNRYFTTLLSPFLFFYPSLLPPSLLDSYHSLFTLWPPYLSIPMHCAQLSPLSRDWKQKPSIMFAPGNVNPCVQFSVHYLLYFAHFIRSSYMGKRIICAPGGEWRYEHTSELPTSSSLLGFTDPTEVGIWVLGVESVKCRY